MSNLYSYPQPGVGEKVQHQQQGQTARAVPEIPSNQAVVYSDQIAYTEQQGLPVQNQLLRQVAGIEQQRLDEYGPSHRHKLRQSRL